MDATFSCVPRQSLRNPNDVVMLLHRRTGHSKRCCRLHRGRSGGTPVHQVTPRRFRRRHGLRGRYTESHLVIPRQHKKMKHGPTSGQQTVSCQHQQNRNPNHGGTAWLPSRIANTGLLLAKMATSDKCLTTRNSETNDINKQSHTHTKRGGLQPAIVAGILFN